MVAKRNISTTESAPVPTSASAAEPATVTAVMTAPAPVQSTDPFKQMPAELEKVTHVLIDQAWNNFTSMEKLAMSIGQTVLDLAKECVASVQGARNSKGELFTEDKLIDLACARFDMATVSALAYIKAEHPESDDTSTKDDNDLTQLARFTRTFGQYKSNIRKGIKAGFDVRQFKSETALRSAVRNAKQSAESGNSGGDTSGTSGLTDAQKETVTAIRETSTAVAKDSDKIAQGIAALLQAIKQADIAAHEDDILLALDKATKTVTKYKAASVAQAKAA